MPIQKTSDLAGMALDYAVALAEGGTGLWHDTIATWWVTMDGKDRALRKGWAQSFTPSADWAQGGPIIERELLEVSPHFESSAPANDWKGAWRWAAYVLGPTNLDDNFEHHGPTPLVAAMRCYVASKLGYEVDVPEGLLP